MPIFLFSRDDYNCFGNERSEFQKQARLTPLREVSLQYYL